MSDTEHRIRERAYLLWEQAGRPHDRGDEFWYVARQEIEAGPGESEYDRIDFPPEARSVEEPPTLAIEAGVPGEIPADSLSLNPAEAEAAEATVPQQRVSQQPDKARVKAAATSTGKPVRKAAPADETTSRKPRSKGGAATPPQRP